MLLSLSACFTNFVDGKDGSSGDEEEQSSNPLANADTRLISLAQVVRTSSSPTSSIDLHGDESGSIGRHCSSEEGNAAASLTCACNFSYTQSDGSVQEFDVDASYGEDNMIRCSTTSVPSTVSLLEVRIHITTADSYSNTVNFRFSSTSASVTPTDSATFQAVRRYQCKQAFYVPHAWDSSVLDPFLSEDNYFAMFANFYTTNMAAAMSHFANSSRNAFTGAQHTERGWICPSTPNDSTFGSELTLYSVAVDGNGDRKIYPPSDPNSDRSTFYLAKAPTGVFTVPFNAFVIPFEATQTTVAANRLPPIGYAAAAIRGSVDGEESCPGSNVAIPSGFKWVKVWGFVSSLGQRSYPTSSNFRNLSGIACNPGLAAATAGAKGIVLNCGDSPDQGAAGPSFLSTTMGSASGTTIADRAVVPIGGDSQNAYCAKINPGGTTNSSAALGSLYTALGLGSDTWKRYGQQNAVGEIQVGVVPPDCSSPSNVLNLCPNTSVGVADLMTDPLDTIPAPLSEATPTWSAPFEVADGQTIADSSPVKDVVYVVSPTTVMSKHLKNSSYSAISNVYRPFRFFTSSDCSSPDPLNPGLKPDGSPDCPALRRIDYQFVNTDSSQYDPETVGVDAELVRHFPLCTLQPVSP